MNERIKALADQAGVVYHTRLGAETNTDDLEKFAELIVRECARISIENDGDWTIQGEQTAQEFMEHFGVEE